MLRNRHDELGISLGQSWLLRVSQIPNRWPFRHSIVILFILFPCWVQAQSSHLQKGLQLVRQGRYAAALPEFEQAERAHPQNAAIQNVLGIINTKLGYLPVADQHYEKAIRLAPKFEEAHKNLGFNYLNEKQYALAEKQLKTAVTLEPADPFAHYYLARLYLGTAHDQQAVEQMEPSRPLLKNDPEAAFEMAQACLHLNQTKAALRLIHALEQRLSVSQEYQLAVALFAKQDYAPAVDLLRRAVVADPQSWTNKYNLAVGLLKIKQTAEATSLLGSLAAERPQDSSILSLLGMAYEAGGNPAKALEAYQNAVRADPKNPDAYLNYTRLLMQLGRYDESQQVVQKGLKAVPDAYALEMRLGSVEMMTGKYAEARASFQKGIAGHPEIPLGYVALAETYLHEQQNEQAAKVLANARKKLPHQFMLEYFYGQALMRSGRKDEAMGILKEAVALNPSVPEGHYELGKVYFESNHLDVARKEFERTIQLSPRFASAYYQLARIYKQQGETGKARQMAERTSELRQAQYAAAQKAQSLLLNRLREQPAH